MSLLDAYALIAFLVGGPAAAQVRALLREGETAVSAANLAEVLDIAKRRYDLPIARAMDLLDPLFDETLDVVPLDRAVARRAAEIRSAHYHRESRPISLADAILLASAPPGASIATADPGVLAIAETEGIATIALSGQG